MVCADPIAAEHLRRVDGLDRLQGGNLPGLAGLPRMGAMAKHRTYRIEFKRQVAQEYIAGETLHALAKRHDLSRNLIRIWVAKYEAGAFEDDIRAADLLQEYEAKIAALERIPQPRAHTSAS